MIVIGVDIGTTSICGIALELDGKRLLHTVTVPNRSGIATNGDAQGGQHPELIVRTVKDIVDRLLLLYPNTAAVGITGQMHGIVYTDKTGHAVSPLFTWQDRKGLLPAGEKTTLADRLSAATGYPLYSGFGLVTHAALLERGEVPGQAERLCTIGDYAALRLVKGRTPVMDASNAAGIGMFDSERGQFDEAALIAAGIGRELLPAVLPSATAVGETGKGIPVYNAIGDNQASVLGSVRDLQESVLLNIGTGGQVSAFTRQYSTADGLETRPFPGGGYLLVGASLAGGKSYAMLERFFRGVLESFSVDGKRGNSDRSGPVELYAQMEALLDRAWPAEDKLAVRTQFFGTRQQAGLRGIIENIGSSNFTPEHLTAGFLEGMAEELVTFYENFPVAVRNRIRKLTGSGNGIRHNKHLRAISEVRFGLPMELPVFREEAAVGAGLHAAVALRRLSGYDAAGQWLKEASTGIV